MFDRLVVDGANVVGARPDGWWSDRAGAAPFPNGKPESPKNGLYLSQTGKPGTFKKLAAPGFAPQERIGRTALGVATGPKQNHNFVYAEVEDARLFNEGQTGQIDAPDQDLGTILARAPCDVGVLSGAGNMAAGPVVTTS